MIRQKMSVILAILMIVSTMAIGFTPITAVPDNGITTDLSAPYKKDNEYEIAPKQSEYSHQIKCVTEPQTISDESLYTRITSNSDGTLTLEVFGSPIKYRTKEGSVNDISLLPVPESGGFRAGDHYLGISFPEKAESGIRLNTGKHVITVTPVTENGIAVETASAYLSDTDAVVYKKDPETSYEYNITYSGYKENIVVSQYTGQTEFFFRIKTDGLLLSVNEVNSHYGGLILADGGKEHASISDVIVFTSDNKNNFFGEISYETVSEGNEYILRISLPLEYLSDPKTHYPIYIDPTISVVYDGSDSDTWNDIEDITVNQNQAADPPGSGTLYVGKAGDDYGAMRAVMRFPELELYGIGPNSITSATVSVRDLMCYGYRIQVDCYGYDGTLPANAFTASNMTWNAVYYAMQDYESGNVYRSTYDVSYGDGVGNGFWYDFNILPVVQGWAHGRNSGTLAKKDQAIVFKSTDSYEQSSNEHYVCFGSFNRATNRPYLTITYNEQTDNSVILSSESLNLLVGNGRYLSAQTNPAGQSVTWSSSNTSVATVNSYGYIYGRSTGSAVISASAGDSVATCLVTVEALNGVFRIQNQDIYESNIMDGYLTDDTNALTLSSYSNQSRNQLWLIKNISGTSRYTLNPLSKTIIDYTGTDYGLCGGEDEYDTGVCIDSISNGDTTYSYGEWFIFGTHASGFRLVSYAANDYNTMITNSNGNGVELEYEENIIDIEEPIDRWLIEPENNLTPITEIGFTVSTVTLYSDVGDRTNDIKNYLVFDSSNAPDYRVSFTKNNNNIMLSAVGIVTAQTLGFTEVTVAIGDYCSSITVRVCSRLIESISLDNDRYHIWSYSGFFDQYTKNDEKKYIWTIDGHTNTDSVCFKSILFDSECQSIVFDQYIP